MTMLVKFTRWCMNPADRTEITVNPKRVDCTEYYSPPYQATDTREAFPACTKIIMVGKQEYLVQGSVDEVQAKLNDEGVIDLPGTFPWKEKQ